MKYKNLKITIAFLVSLIITSAVITYQIGKVISKKNNINQTSEINNDRNDKTMNKRNINVIINGETYATTLEGNEMVKAFIKMLPQEFNMSDLNNNEKYIYMDKSLPVEPFKPEYIEAGDIMLYGDNCLVVFYKSFNTSYSYTKIGHITNFPNLGSSSVVVKFE